MNLHRLSVAACVRLIQEEDAAVLVALRKARPALARFIAASAARFQDEDTGPGGRLIYLGAGTSGRLGVLDASEAPPTFCVSPGRIVGIIAGGESALRKSSEGKEDDPNGAEPDLRALRLHPTDTLLAIAAGGTTPYAVGALALAKRLTAGRCLTGLLTCSPVPKPPAADHFILLRTGPEVLTGSTRMKAGTATKLALNTISTTLMVQRGRVYENLMIDVKATNAKLLDRAARIVSTLTGLDRTEALAAVRAANGSAKHAVLGRRALPSKPGARGARAGLPSPMPRTTKIPNPTRPRG
jgi:N-acetylmuramic acid 6-phosphate etherase